jgi:hypothetical protein
MNSQLVKLMKRGLFFMNQSQNQEILFLKVIQSGSRYQLVGNQYLDGGVGVQIISLTVTLRVSICVYYLFFCRDIQKEKH